MLLPLLQNNLLTIEPFAGNVFDQESKVVELVDEESDVAQVVDEDQVVGEA